MEYDFKITLADSTVINSPNPKGWNDLSLILTRSEENWLIEFSSTLDYFGDIYQQLSDYIRGTDPISDPGSPCSINELEILGRCNPYEAFERIVLATWKASDVEFDCNKCILSIKPSDTGGIQRLQEKADETYSFNGEQITLFEVESCFEFETNPERPFVSILDALQGIGSQLGVDIQSTILSTPFEPHIVSMEIPANTGGNTMQVRIETAFGDVHTAIVNGAGTAEETAEKIRILFCQGLGNSVAAEPHFLARKIANVTISGFELTFTSNVEILDMQVLVNGTEVPATQTVIQAWQYGLEGLAISNEGLTRFADINLTYQMLLDLLKGIAPFTVRELDGVVYIDPEPIQYQNAGGFTSSINVTNYKETIDDQWLKGHLVVGSDFEVKSFQESQDNWTWEQSTVEDSENLSGLTGSNPVATTVDRLGIAVLRGQLHISGNTLTNGILRITVGTQIFDLNTITFTTDPTILPIEDMLVDPVPSICFEAGDTLQLEWIGLGGSAIFDTGTNLRLDYNVQPYPNPQINESGHDQINQFELTTFDCLEQETIRIPKDIYGLTGYALSQQMKELHDYDSTFFLTFIDPNDPTKARAFTYCMYDPFDCNDCNQLKNWCFYNIPLLRPFVVQQYAPIVPQNIDQNALDITYIWENDGCLQPFVATSNDGEYVRTKTSIMDINAVDLCMDTKTIRALIADLGANITTSCDEATFGASWKNVNFNFADGTATANFSPV